MLIHDCTSFQRKLLIRKLQYRNRLFILMKNDCFLCPKEHSIDKKTKIYVRKELIDIESDLWTVITVKMIYN